MSLYCSNTGVVGSNSTRGMDVCQCIFCAVLASARRSFARGPCPLLRHMDPITSRNVRSNSELEQVARINPQKARRSRHSNLVNYEILKRDKTQKSLKGFGVLCELYRIHKDV
jgi:hypothetical protein